MKKHINLRDVLFVALLLFVFVYFVFGLSEDSSGLLMNSALQIVNNDPGKDLMFSGALVERAPTAAELEILNSYVAKVLVIIPLLFVTFILSFVIFNSLIWNWLVYRKIRVTRILRQIIMVIPWFILVAIMGMIIIGLLGFSYTLYSVLAWISTLIIFILLTLITYFLMVVTIILYRQLTITTIPWTKPKAQKNTSFWKRCVHILKVYWSWLGHATRETLTSVSQTWELAIMGAPRYVKGFCVGIAINIVVFWPVFYLLFKNGFYFAETVVLVLEIITIAWFITYVDKKCKNK
ncbi:MAG: hypothetical protein ACI8Y7_000099 [Candidatus Woesearchaeota archaeon]|jgi:hypothetical protein